MPAYTRLHLTQCSQVTKNKALSFSYLCLEHTALNSPAMNCVCVCVQCVSVSVCMHAQ